MTAQQIQPDITIRDIEVELTRFRPNWAPGVELRELALLFAILKVGQSTQKLVWFTQYPATFIINLVEELRQRGKLYTGLSPQFVLSQCPGSEDLIAVVTGARPYVPTAEPVKPVIRRALAPAIKEESMSKPKPEPPATDTAENCWCGREARHKGRHRGQGPGTKKAAAVKSAPVVAEKRQPEPKAEPKPEAPRAAGQASRKTIPFAGGTLTLVVDVNLLELRGTEREFVFALIDQLQGYEAKEVA